MARAVSILVRLRIGRSWRILVGHVPGNREGMSSDPVEPRTFDLAESSRENHVRQRRLRLVGVALPIVGAAALGYTDWLVIVFSLGNPGSAALGCLIAAVGLLILCLCVSLAGYFYRRLAPPPISMTIHGMGVTFRRTAGAPYRLRWSDPGLDIRVLDLSNDSRRGLASQFRSWIAGSRLDRQLPWRPLCPIVFEPKAAGLAFVEAARKAGCYILEEPNPAPDSPTFQNPSKAWRIQAPPLGIRV